MLPSGRVAVFGSVLSGVLVGAAFGLPLGWIVAQLALVGVLWLLDRASASPRRAAGLGAAFSLGMVAIGFSGFVLGLPEDLRAWAVLPWIGYGIVFSAVAALLAWSVCKLPLSSAWRWTIAWPATWMLFEWTVGQGSIGMPWLRLGQLHAPSGPLAGILPIGGVLLVGALMWVMAALLLRALQARRLTNVVCATMVLASVLAVGGLSKSVEWTEATSPIRAVLVQPGDDVRAPTNGQRALDHWFEHYRAIALNSQAQLVITPQLALPASSQSVPAARWQQLSDELAQRGTDLLIGVSFDTPAGRAYNAGRSIGASGWQHYLKQQLFPFGEFVPASGRARTWIDHAMGSPIFDREPGPPDQPTLKLAGQRAAAMICFEVAFPQVWREQAAVASMLIQLAGDDSVSSALLSRQFQQMAQARALEFAKPLLRTSHTHGTYAVDHHGVVIAAAPANEQTALAFTVVPRMGITPYAQFGDSLALALATIALALATIWQAYRAEVLTTSVGSGTALPRLRRVPLRQSGQIMMPAIVLLLISAGLFYLMVNSSQAINEKTRMTNAADAAAYSASVVEARALNFHAYTNRALVANQMVIAQMVSFTSWIRYFGIAVNNIGRADVAAEMTYMLWPSPQAFTTAIVFASAQAALTAAGTTGNALAQQVAFVTGIATSLHEGASRGLSASQRLVQLNLSAGAQQQQIANQVVRSMDAGMSAVVVVTSHGFDQFTRRYARDSGGGGADERARFADVAMRSRDEFTRQRNWTIRSPFDISRWLPGGRQNGALKKRGGTELVNFDEWRAMDTLEMHGQHVCWRRGTPRWCPDIQLPVGWGAANVDAGGADADRGFHGNAYGENPRTAGLAQNSMVNVPSALPYSGIPASQELSNLAPDADRTTGITILVRKQHADMLTSGGAAQARPSGELARFNNRPAGARMVALSRAQVFFDRIDARPDGRVELGSLYNPYWRVRLVAHTQADRTFASTQQGGLFLP
jgi:apolipoprotein N-acyltransferase